MDDVVFDFHIENQKKKEIGRSIRFRKSGGGMCSCSLSQDQLSNKELESYNLSKPMDWKQFRLMPRDIQKEYLEKLRRQYNATGCIIGKMMGVNKTTLNLYLKDTVLADPMKHRRMSEAQILAWDNFVNPPANDVVDDAGDVIKPLEETPVQAQVCDEADMKIFRAHDLDANTSVKTQTNSYAAIPKLSFRLAGTPGEMLLSLQGLLNALPWSETYEAEISMAQQDGDLL